MLRASLRAVCAMRPKESAATAGRSRSCMRPPPQDHLRWERAHIVGHSMGGMIAMRLALLAPQRVRSLSVLSVTGGGWQSLPLSWRATKYMWKVGFGPHITQVEILQVVCRSGAVTGEPPRAASWGASATMHCQIVTPMPAARQILYLQAFPFHFLSLSPPAPVVRPGPLHPPAQAFRADGSKARAKYDLKFHFMHDTLRQYVSHGLRLHLWHQLAAS